MKLSELAQHQHDWELKRGISSEVNGNFNTDRIQAELDEAKAEDEPFKALQELLDTVIISAGGLAQAAEAAGVPFEELDNLLLIKLEINATKYPESERANYGSTAEYIDFCRRRWADFMGET